MIQNYLFRLLFDYRGSISRREYWAGIVVAFMCIGIFQQELLWTNFITSAVLSSYQDYAPIPTHLINQTLNTAFFVDFPFLVIALYIFVNITVKRGRALGYTTTKSVLSGVLIYLLNSCSIGVVYSFYTYSTFNSRFDEVLDENIFLKIMPYLFLACILAGIISLIYVCMQKREEDEVYYIFDDGTVNTLVRFGKLMLASLVAVVVSAILCFLLFDIYESAEYLPVMGWILLFIYACLVLYILIKRAIDAAVKPVYLIISIVVLMLVSWLLFILIENKLFGIFSLALLIRNWLFLFFNLGIFVLIALPSKKQEQNTENTLELD